MSVILRGKSIFGEVGGLLLLLRQSVLDVSCETRVNHQNPFLWQAQYLVKFEGDSCCFTHCTGGRFMPWTIKRSNTL